jgi:isopenicillin N synthase-like dioxygenase
MPETFNVNSLEQMADNFFKEKSESLSARDNAYRGYKKGPSDYTSQEFYFDSENNQFESLYLNREAFIKHPNTLPLELKTPVTEMLNISVLVLKSFLKAAGIPNNLWAEATNGAFDESIPEFNIGFNHYRSDKQVLGAIPHKDSGWLTLFYSVEPGLQAYINNNWVSINPIDGYFTVNFGFGLDVLTKNAKKTCCCIVASSHSTK